MRHRVQQTCVVKDHDHLGGVAEEEPPQHHHAAHLGITIINTITIAITITLTITIVITITATITFPTAIRTMPTMALSSRAILKDKEGQPL